MKPDFKNIKIQKDLSRDSQSLTARKHVRKRQECWTTAEQIPVKPVFTKDDLDRMEHLSYAAGFLPTCAGPIPPCM